MIKMFVSRYYDEICKQIEEFKKNSSIVIDKTHVYESEFLCDDRMLITIEYHKKGKINEKEVSVF